MAVLVTGGAGYVGSHMVLRLCDAGETVVALDNLVTGFDWAVDPRATLVNGDAGDMTLVGSLIATHEILEIMHFAGSVVVPDSIVDPLKYYANNTSASRNLIEVAVKGGVKHVVFSSTAAVYGMTGLEPIAEEAPLSPISPYGRSKLMTEMMLSDVAATHALTCGILRYFNVAGADPGGRSGQSTQRATHLIKATIQAALGQRDHVDVFGTDFPTPDGTGMRDYIHVSDLVEAHKLLLDYLRAGGESITLNCGYGRGYSVQQVIDMVRAVSEAEFSVRPTGRRLGDPASVIAKVDKLRAVLGWQPAHDDLEEIVTSAYEWERYLVTRNR